MTIVILNRDDLEVLIEVSQWMVDYKKGALKAKNWQKFETEFFPLLIRLFQEGSGEVRSPTRNIFAWLADQLRNSQRYCDGEWQHISRHPQGQRAIDICDMASGGPRSYQRYRNQQQVKKLFPD